MWRDRLDAPERDEGIRTLETQLVFGGGSEEENRFCTAVNTQAEIFRYSLLQILEKALAAESN